MARKSRSTGVGRGNGPGSTKTQFKNGMPSANPLGAGAKPKEAPPRSFKDALENALRRKIKMTFDGKEIYMIQYQAMAETLLADYGSASPAMKMRIMQLCMEVVPDLSETIPQQPSQDAIANVIAALIAEEERDEEVCRNLAPYIRAH